MINFTSSASSLSMDSDLVQSLDFCPFQTDDELLFKIWGEWAGKDPTLVHGNKTGELFISIIFRNESLLRMYEKKTELIVGQLESSNVSLSNNPESFWSFDPITRHGIFLDTYAWMWVASPDMQIGRNVTIFNYPFQATEQLEYLFNGTLYKTIKMVYVKNIVLKNGDLRIIEFQFLYALQSGHVMHYYASSNTFYANGSLYNSEYYTISLNRTTVDLDKIYGTIPPKVQFFTLFLVSSFFLGTITLITLLIWKKRL
ncbi:MAG: hypothetical protein ACFE95_16875 [Candidatus Hodarchaeota archaeon]